MIPILLDNSHSPNVFLPNAVESNIMDTYYSPKYRAILPRQLHSFDLSIHTVKEIDQIDWFVYPIIINEPYYQIRHFHNPDHPTYGIYNMIPSEVYEAVKAKKGVIFVDITGEPLENHDLSQVRQGFANEEFNIFFNIGSPKQVDNKLFFTFLGWMEDYFNLVKQSRQSYNNLHTSDGKGMFCKRDKRAFSLFNARYEKHPGASIIVSLLDRLDLMKHGHVYVQDKASNIVNAYDIAKQQLKDSPAFLGRYKAQPISNPEHIYPKPLFMDYSLSLSHFNLVVEAYYTYEMVNWPYISEKTWRNIQLKKPFVLVGQKNTLAEFHRLGYKSFHPYINESYDSMDDSVRVLHAAKEVKRLCNFTTQQWQEFHKNVEHIHKHNCEQFKARKREFKEFLYGFRRN